MGVILDSSVAIAAERRGDTVGRLLRLIAASFGDQEAALSSIGLTELVHGIYRATTPEIRKRRERFITDLATEIPVYPYTRDTALVAGRLDAEQQARGTVIPFPDLLIAATALSLGYGVVTVNLRDFAKIPGLTVLQLPLS
jgi:predicted nucleic acid-binding protein